MLRKERMGNKLAFEKIYLFFRNFFMRNPVKIYITTSVICFLVLVLVQIVLVYNTYDLLNRRFYYEKKDKINELYARAIVNDKLFPGGQRIIDSFIVREYNRLEPLYKKDRAAFDRETQILLNALFAELARRQNVDSLMRDIKKRGDITDSLRYALSIRGMDLMFGDMKYVNIYSSKKKYPLINPAMQDANGIRLFGDLPEPDIKNQIFTLNVTTPVAYSYAITFAFHADPYNRRQLVFDQMRPMLVTSLLSMLAIITLFIVTLRNWLKQKHLSEVKTDFINNITHEFHTPLSAIMVANKNIQNEKVLGNKQALLSLSAIIQRQSERLKLLISQVLDIATIDQLSVQKHPRELGGLVSEILEDYRMKSSGADLRLSFTEKTGAVIVDVDTFHFTTLLLNILDNAVKYNRQQVKQINVSLLPDKDGVQLVISDNGIGMTRDTLQHIFDKFYRHQKDLTQQIKGLGLGLHYVRQCIEAHHWKIKVESEPGAGSTFMITIPTVNDPDTLKRQTDEGGPSRPIKKQKTAR